MCFFSPRDLSRNKISYEIVHMNLKTKIPPSPPQKITPGGKGGPTLTHMSHESGTNV